MSLFQRKPDVKALEAKGDIDRLIKALEHKDPEIRFATVGALGRLKNLDAMLSALYDTSEKCRALAAHFIGQIEIGKGESFATVTLVDGLRDRYSGTRYNTAVSLELIGDWRGIEYVRQAYNVEPDHAVRLALERTYKHLLICEKANRSE